MNWIQLHWLKFELNWIKFINWIEIQLKKNGMQIGGKGYVHEYGIEKTTLKWHKYGRKKFHAYLFSNGLN
jgi:hypothetical protein